MKPEQIEKEAQEKLKEAHAAYGVKIHKAFHLLTNGACSRQEYDLWTTSARVGYMREWESIETEYHRRMGNYAEGK